MLNIDINRIRKEDAISAHALLLTLRHFNHMNDLFSIEFIDDKYYVFIEDDVYDFDTFDEIPTFVICTVCKEFEDIIDYRRFYSNVLKVGFNNNDALDYLNFYSDSEKKLTMTK